MLDTFRMSDWLKRHKEERTEPEDRAGSLDELKEALRALEEPVNARTPKPCGPILKRIEALDLPAPWREETERLVAHIRSYQFHPADRDIARLREKLDA